jgi:hypothetical protein
MARARKEHTSAPPTLTQEPRRQVTDSSGGRVSGARARRRRAAQRRRRRSAVLALLAVTVGLVGLDYMRGGSASNDPTSGAIRTLVPEDGAELAPLPPSLVPQASQPALNPPAQTKSVPQHGTGSFAVAPGRSEVVGGGQLMTYRVEAENGSGEEAATFAAEVDKTLADPRGWTAKGEWSFRRVSSGRVDFVVRLATPDTVDRICGAAGLTTGGFTSCRTGQFVVVNLARWELAVPDYQGNVALYRQYVVNHEVGHRLGHGHELCPGPGKLAPIMQQQTYGLNGCIANGWPFVDGRYVSGPPTSAN